jgi:DNA-binding response OmpR family regulator
VRLRILCVGVDPRLLKSRQMILASRGYDASTATSLNVDTKLAAGTFDLVILSAMLSDEEKSRVESILPPETKVISLTTLVHPDDLFELVTRAIGFRR